MRRARRPRPPSTAVYRPAPEPTVADWLRFEAIGSSGSASVRPPNASGALRTPRPSPHAFALGTALGLAPLAHDPSQEGSGSGKERYYGDQEEPQPHQDPHRQR